MNQLEVIYPRREKEKIDIQYSTRSSFVRVVVSNPEGNDDAIIVPDRWVDRRHVLLYIKAGALIDPDSPIVKTYRGMVTISGEPYLTLDTYRNEYTNKNSLILKADKVLLSDADGGSNRSAMYEYLSTASARDIMTSLGVKPQASLDKPLVTAFKVRKIWHCEEPTYMWIFSNTYPKLYEEAMNHSFILLYVKNGAHIQNYIKLNNAWIDLNSPPKERTPWWKKLFRKKTAEPIRLSKEYIYSRKFNESIVTLLAKEPMKMAVIYGDLEEDNITLEGGYDQMGHEMSESFIVKAADCLGFNAKRKEKRIGYEQR